MQEGVLSYGRAPARHLLLLFLECHQVPQIVANGLLLFILWSPFAEEESSFGDCEVPLPLIGLIQVECVLSILTMELFLYLFRVPSYLSMVLWLMLLSLDLEALINAQLLPGCDVYLILVP